MWEAQISDPLPLSFLEDKKKGATPPSSYFFKP